jgi:hypothetical protein
MTEEPSSCEMCAHKGFQIIIVHNTSCSLVLISSQEKGGRLSVLTGRYHYCGVELLKVVDIKTLSFGM